MAHDNKGGNQYIEKWTLEESEEFLKKAVKLSNSREFDFIGEVAKEQGSYHHVYKYIVDKFPSLKEYLVEIKSNCETNCFFNGKKGNITPSLSIMNLKSNHGWTDRIESKNDNTEKVTINWVEEKTYNTNSEFETNS
jgi:hypothetical protein